MRRGTTPVIIINVSGTDIDTIKEWYITIEQGDYQILKRNDNIEFEDDGSLHIHLTQEETLNFHKGRIDVQIRAVTVDDDRIASNIQSANVEDILYEGVI